jgi:rhodanese-related sulfurtransferase
MAMRLLKDMTLIFVVAGAIAVVINLFNPRGFVLVSRSSLEQRNIVPVTAMEAKIKYDNGVAVFIDARDKSEYEHAHIRGAINIPVSDAMAKQGMGEKFEFLKRPVEVVVYCDGPTCGASESMAKLFLERGYRRNIYIIQKGFPEWELHEYPVERGE